MKIRCRDSRDFIKRVNSNNQSKTPIHAFNWFSPKVAANSSIVSRGLTINRDTLYVP